jgi:lipoprotein-anchoring transpeptidase ErfK/SrfK
VELQVGDEGEAVAQVQRRLQELGYFLPAVDGVFGSSTRQAVWALQKTAGIGRDGLIGPDTRAALDAGTRPTPRSTTGHVLEVDLVAQIVLAVQDGQVVATINASSGSGREFVALGKTLTAYTPRGDFTVVREINGMHESSLELGPMYRPKYFRGGVAIHGAPSVPPYPASHGCVRVSNDAINWIWDQFGAPVGTPILVYGR